jgi:hypothetical protein
MHPNLMQHYKAAVEAFVQNRRNAGFSEAQSRYIVECAAALAEIVVMSPPVDHEGNPINLVVVGTEKKK